MAVSAESKIIIDVSLNAEDAAARANDLAASIKAIKVEQAGLKKSGDETSVAYAQNAVQLRTLTAEQKSYIVMSQNSEGSNNKLRAQLALLTTQYNALGDRERDTTTAGLALQTQIKAVSDELKRTEGAVGDTRRNVGNYADSLKNATKSQQSLTSEITRTATGFGFLPTGVANATKTFTNFVQSQRNVIQGFQQIKILQSEAVIATEAATVATEAAAVAETQLAAGEITQMEASLAATTAASAQTAAITAQATATEAATAATGLLKIALASTGIGLLIIAVASLYEYFTNTNDGAKEFGVITARNSAVIDVFRGKINELGREIFNYKKGVEDTGEAQEKTFGQKALDNIKAYALKVAETARNIAGILAGTGINDALDGGATKKQTKAAADLAEAYTRAFQKMTIDEREYTNTTKIELTNELNVSRARIRNLHYTTDERQAAAETAKSLLKQIYDKDLYFAKESQRILEGQQKQRADAGVKVDKAAIAAAKGRILTLKGQYDQQYEMLDAREARVDKIEDGARKKQAALDAKANEELIKSQLATSATLLTNRQKEVEDINSDIDKRVRTYEKYGRVTTQLEAERTARLTALSQKYYEEDSKIIESAYQKSIDLRIQTYTDGADREEAVRKQKQIRELADIDAQILAISSRVAKGEQDKNHVLDALFAERKAATDKQDADDLQKAIDDANAEFERRRLNQEKTQQDQQAALEYDQQIADARMEINTAMLQNYEDLFGGISDLLGKNTAAGKIAFGIMKGLAIAEIIIGTQRALIQLEIAEAAQIAAASLSVFGLAAIPGIIALNAAKKAEIITQGVISGVLVAAQTVATVATGKAKGGIQDYTSDGKGGVLKGYATKDDTNAYLRSGEAVVVSEAAKDPSTRRLLSDINVAYGGNPYPGLALGGIYGGSGLQQTNSDITGQVFQQNKLNEAISRLKIYTAITDVREADANYTKLIDAATF